jgi:DNA-directed RNA polymerase specialized sigma24 family protein
VAPDADDDAELVRRFLSDRDERAFRVLYRRHAPAMHGVLRRMLGAADAEDALQETWLRAARGLEGFRGIGGMLGIEPGTSKSQLSHARRAVRSWLAGGERTTA